MQGVVDKFIVAKGFGFIKEDGSNATKGHFVHINDVVDKGDKGDLNEGDRVEFEIGSGNDGRAKAINVKRI